MRVRFKLLREDARVPSYATEGAAGLDLAAAVDAPVVVPAGGYAMVPTGVAIALPPNTEGQVRPRSGLAARHGLTVLNSPGTIDADYRGEIRVLLVNHGARDFEVRHGFRIAQLVVAEVARVSAVVVDELDVTERGESGFGSTGLSDA